MAKIVGYAELKPDAFEIRQNLLSEKEKEILRNSMNIVQCIALRDIDSFETYKELTSEEYDLIYTEGFILKDIYEDGRCLYIRKEK